MPSHKLGFKLHLGFGSLEYRRWSGVDGAMARVASS